MVHQVACLCIPDSEYLLNILKDISRIATIGSFVLPFRYWERSTDFSSSPMIAFRGLTWPYVDEELVFLAHGRYASKLDFPIMRYCYGSARI